VWREGGRTGRRTRGGEWAPQYGRDRYRIPEGIPCVLLSLNLSANTRGEGRGAVGGAAIPAGRGGEGVVIPEGRRVFVAVVELVCEYARGGARGGGWRRNTGGEGRGGSRIPSQVPGEEHAFL